MGKQDKKGPFAFLSLNRGQSEWFVDYLQGKNRDEETETRRREMLKAARRQADDNTVCLKS